MASKAGIEQLIERDVFERACDQQLRLTDSFGSTVDTYRKCLDAADNDEMEATIETVVDDGETAVQLCTRTEYDPDLLSRFVAIRERGTELTVTETVLVAIITEQLEDGVPPEHGAPDGFVPVTGPGLMKLVETCERCLVYIWRDECDPCKDVRSDLEAIVAEEPPTETIPLAVYGPDCGRLLRTEYDVVGAPTVLCTADGSIETRLVGPTAREKLATELRLIGQ
ncbi:hypothetical protein [Natronococcus sp. A-GB7]|uniref:hypothetical protein n=1 Tax=Natronococcus sp. A-GB7 TaxID=3037649 RepID=UPI00241EF169|nr:hypothetical protein [Natronococcus sp. A-GB7]MDG5821395.1 hypothetical protein [Natronococcus sp. A-GB7]